MARGDGRGLARRAESRLRAKGIGIGSFREFGFKLEPNFSHYMQPNLFQIINPNFQFLKLVQVNSVDPNQFFIHYSFALQNINGGA